MLNSIRVSFKDSLIYGIGNIAVKLIGFILIPLFTNPKFFSVEDFGIMTLLDISGLVLISVMASGLPQSLIRWYWDKDHVSNQKEIFFMSLSTQTIISLLFCLFILPFTSQISMIIFGTENRSDVIKLLILATSMQAINNVINTLIRVQSKSALFSLVNFSKLLIVLVLTLFFILNMKIGLIGIYLAQVIGNLLFIIFLSGYAIKNCKVSFNLNVLKSMSMYGFPLMLANFAGASLAVIDRYSLNSMALLKFVAIYSLAFKIASVLKLVIVDSIKMAISPMIIQKINSPENKRFYSKTLLYSSFILMIGIIGISLFSLELIKFMSKSTEFWGAYIVMPILSISIFFVNMRETTSYGLIIKKKSWIFGLIVVISGIINFLLNFLLIPKFNIVGAAMATLITNIFYWFTCYYFSQKAFYVPYEIRKIFIMLLVGTILSSAGLFLANLQLIPRLIIKTGCFISFPFILYLFNFYEPVELQAIRGFVFKWSKIKNLRNNLNSLKGVTDKA
jgi:O-antigen/teichoic acid export membrane protein